MDMLNKSQDLRKIGKPVAIIYFIIGVVLIIEGLFLYGKAPGTNLPLISIGGGIAFMLLGLLWIKCIDKLAHSLNK
jgi:hypothetical protein